MPISKPPLGRPNRGAKNPYLEPLSRPHSSRRSSKQEATESTLERPRSQQNGRRASIDPAQWNLMVQERKQSQVQVCVRVRPLLPRDQRNGHSKTAFKFPAEDRIVLGKTAAKIAQEGETRLRSLQGAMQFDWVFKPEAHQRQVFQSVVQPFMDKILQGFNGTIFAYGQTASGKTHTILGDYKHDLRSEHAGIFPRVVRSIFNYVATEKDKPENQDRDAQYLVHMSALEIYNEKVRDLLSETPQAFVELREHPKKGFFVPNLSRHIISAEGEVLMLMEQAMLNRATAETEKNMASSRSHLIISINIETSKLVGPASMNVERKRIIEVAKLNLVDLAGSESLQDRTEVLAKETKNINKSLMCLAKVISTLAKVAEKEDSMLTKKQSKQAGHMHIPYRDSKLTMLLRDSLGGSSQTLMIACASPCLDDLRESTSTLRYASRAKKIKNRVRKNLVNGEDTMIQRLSEEVDELKGALHQAEVEAENLRVLMQRKENASNAAYQTRLEHSETVTKTQAEYIKRLKGVMRKFQIELTQLRQEKEKLVWELRRTRRVQQLQAARLANAAKLPTTQQTSITTHNSPGLAKLSKVRNFIRAVRRWKSGANKAHPIEISPSRSNSIQVVS